MMVKENYSLKAHNTFGIDVSTRYFAEYSSVLELKELLSSGIIKSNRLLHIGSGSNLLFINNFDGAILHSNIKTIEVIDEKKDTVLVKAGSGVIWDDFVAYCVENNWYGVENLSLIPGEVGAAAVQNIGAYGIEVKDTIYNVETIEVKTNLEKVFSHEACNYSYRQSIFKKDLKGKYIITHVTFRLKKTSVFHLDYQAIRDSVMANGEITLQNVRKTVIKIRQEKLPDPKIFGNAGSFFMNPIISLDKFTEFQKKYPKIPHYITSENEVKIPAGWLIEQCGFKGIAVGNAGVYEKQALVLINLGNATGKDIANLSEKVQNGVEQKFGVRLIPEVNFIK